MSEATQDSGSAPTKPKTEVTLIKMTDGREVGFAGKRKMLKEVLVDEKGVRVRFDFRSGETRTFPVRDAYFYQAAGHGISQKYGDECAGLEDVDDMVLAVDKLDAHLAKATDAAGWNRQREGTGLGGTSVLLRALMELSGKAVEEVEAFLSAKSQAEKLALRNSAKVKPIVERIEQEKASKAAKVDTDALLREGGFLS